MKPKEKAEEVLAEHKCKFYVNADWSYLRCDCGKRIKPSEGVKSFTAKEVADMLFKDFSTVEQAIHYFDNLNQHH